MFENAFKYVDDILRKDAGCSTALDYVEQSSWILFLKYLDDFENDRSAAAALTGAKYKPIIESKYQWKTWAAPKDATGKKEILESQSRLKPKGILVAKE
jgi:type I restriction enzyme M protein